MCPWPVCWNAWAVVTGVTVPVCNLEPLCCPKYTLVSQEGPLHVVQAFHLRSGEEGASFLSGPSNPVNEVSQDGLLGKEEKEKWEQCPVKGLWETELPAS